MRLFLASEGKAIMDKIELPTKEILFIGNGGDLHENRQWVEDTKNELKKLGYELEDFDLREGNLALALKRHKVLFVNGGNCLYLLKLMNEAIDKNDFLKWLEEGIFIGSSAGSAIMGPRLEPYELMDDYDKVPKPHDYKGYGLANKVIIPHGNREKYQQVCKDTIEKFGQDFNLVVLNDGEYIDENGEIIKTQ